MNAESEKSSPVLSSEPKSPPESLPLNLGDDPSGPTKSSTPEPEPEPKSPSVPAAAASKPKPKVPTAPPPPPPTYLKRIIITQETDGQWTAKVKLSDPARPLMRPELSKITRTLLLEYRKQLAQYHMNAAEEKRLNALAEEDLRASGDIVSDGVVVTEEDLPPGPRPVDGNGTPINRTPAEAAFYESKLA